MEDDREKMKGRAHRNAMIKLLVISGVIAFVLICTGMYIASKFINQ